VIYRGIQLDPFQVAAIEAIERHDTVIVSAPTGAGKTVIAEYAIEAYLKQGRRIIYTAPIKALSNQKFRDFTAAWGDRIGIITGDVSINPTAPVLIMTTEIFRNTVFDDPERLHDVEYVILDEIHFINDIHRGTVWEESLLFAPQHIGFICLSATIPNLSQFADWLREVRPQLDVAVIQEEHRPVPLEHHLWLPGHGEVQRKELRKLVDVVRAKGRKLQPNDVRKALGAGKRDPVGRGDVVLHLHHLGRLPALYFCFSRLACEELASRYRYHNLLAPGEREQLLDVFDVLRERFGLTDDANADRVRDMLSHGVCFHHAGILPMLKEIIERCFNSGLLKLLFTTETFAVGVNMPACSAVFDSLMKYDGVDTRYLLTREYQQMAGRAGRRGIDPVGYVYSRIDLQRADIDEIERMLIGEVEPTESQFNLSYSSILSLYRDYGEEIYTVCERSFANFQNIIRVRELQAELAGIEAQELAAIDCFKGVPKSIRKFIEAKEELGRAKGRAEGERQRAERRHRGKGAKRALERELRLIEQPIERLEQQLAHSDCYRCRQFNQCTRIQQQINQHRERADQVRKQIRDLGHFQRQQITRRLTLLREFDYVDEHGLTPKGQMAAALYGFELPITELFYAGFFEDATEVEIACLMVAIVFESKRSGWYQAIRDAELKLYLREAALLMRDVARREFELGIEGGTEPLDDALTMATVAWMEGADLDDLQQHTDSSDGDIVRSLRHAVDLLRQFRRVVEDHAFLRGKLDATVRQLRRGEVDAERQLRLGHEMDRVAAEVLAEE
jgi:superfamily II RNA helicase